MLGFQSAITPTVLPVMLCSVYVICLYILLPYFQIDIPKTNIQDYLKNMNDFLNVNIIEET